MSDLSANSAPPIHEAESPRPNYPGPSAAALAKQEKLFACLRALDGVLIAFSGGADSAYLAWAAHQMLGGRALSVTALSPSYSAHDREVAGKFAAATGLRHEWIETHEFENPFYVANTHPDRCYHCKDELFRQMEALARERHFPAIAYGVNADDTRDFRPGHRAAAEHRVLAPLLEAALAKTEIRALARHAGLSIWDRPASACLSSRLPYGTPVTLQVLSLVERAESEIRAMNFRQFRVRAHGDLARVEIAPEELPRALSPAVLNEISARLRRVGFAYVTLDMEGYRQGSLNETLKSR